MTEAMKISCRNATINALKEEIAGLNKHRKKIQTENKQLKTELEKAQCCGSCKHWNYFVEEKGIETCCIISGVYGIWPSNYCVQWEVRE